MVLVFPTIQDPVYVVRYVRPRNACETHAWMVRFVGFGTRTSDLVSLRLSAYKAAEDKHMGEGRSMKT